MALPELITKEAAFLDAFEARTAMEFAAVPGAVLHLFSLEKSLGRIGDLFALLSGPEIERAAEIRHAERRVAFVASRALLRAALTEFSKGVVSPGAWTFGTGIHGKPYVSSPQGIGLRFSLSYTEKLIAIAISDRFELGIDIEAVAQAHAEVPWQVLTPAERHFLRTLPEAARFEEFLKLWTIKEAYTKYLGVGAALDFRKVEVSTAPERTGARSEAESRLPEPMIKQKLMVVDGETIVFAIAAGKAEAGRFVTPAGEAVALLHRV